MKVSIGSDAVYAVEKYLSNGCVAGGTSCLEIISRSVKLNQFLFLFCGILDFVSFFLFMLSSYEFKIVYFCYIFLLTKMKFYFIS